MGTAVGFRALLAALGTIATGVIVGQIVWWSTDGPLGPSHQSEAVVVPPTLDVTPAPERRPEPTPEGVGGRYGGSLTLGLQTPTENTEVTRELLLDIGDVDKENQFSGKVRMMFFGLGEASPIWGTIDGNRIDFSTNQEDSIGYFWFEGRISGSRIVGAWGSKLKDSYFQMLKDDETYTAFREAGGEIFWNGKFEVSR